MSRYYENDGECGKRRSSATAKTALGLAIGGLSLAAVNGGLFGNSDGGCCGNNGGILGNLFGRNGSGSCCCQTKMENGERAITEVQMLDKYLFPMMHRTCDLETFAAVQPYKTELQMLDKYIFPIMARTCALEKESAVNKAVDEKNQIINGLLFKMAKENTDAQFALADCRTTGKFDLVQQRTDAEFALSRALTTADIEKATCNVVRGKPYISPCQMADPYNAGTNVLLTRHINAGLNTYSDGAWSGYSNGGCCNGF